MGEVKTFRITGEIKKQTGNIKFSKELNALGKDQALDTLYSQLGSKHKAKRFEITIAKVEEVKAALKK
jgi:large subunit ribosomal protein LX